MAFKRPEAVLIAGPTASGKSAIALALAERLDGVIINADSAQIYRELAIITARPTSADEARAPHRLYGYRPATEACSVADWLEDAAREIAAARRAGQPAIVVGGTGLYFRVLTQGLVAIPDIPAGIRSHWRGEAGTRGPEALHEELRKRDPVMAARLRPSDSQRIARAIEVIDATGRSLADWQADPPTVPVLKISDTPAFVVAIERSLLHDRINRRFDVMIAAGALEEARAIAALRLDPALPAARAIGVRPLVDVVNGDLDLAAAISQAKAESRQYAKRQETWFRHQIADWTRLTWDAGIDTLAARIRMGLK